MKLFNLYYDTKETVWHRQAYNVSAETEAEAVEELKKLIASNERENKFVTKCDGDYLLDTGELMLPVDNNGCATEIIYRQPTNSIIDPVELWANSEEELSSDPLPPVNKTAPSTLITIDVDQAAQEMAAKGFDGKDFEGWSNELLEILENRYGIEAAVSAKLGRYPYAEPFEPHTPTHAFFTLDGENQYAGIHYPNINWNGFCVPYFTLHVAKKILIDVDHKHVVTDDGIIYDNTAHIQYHPVTINGEKMYSIGGHYWTWTKADES